MIVGNRRRTRCMVNQIVNPRERRTSQIVYLSTRSIRGKEFKDDAGGTGRTYIAEGTGGEDVNACNPKYVKKAWTCLHSPDVLPKVKSISAFGVTNCYQDVDLYNSVPSAQTYLPRFSPQHLLANLVQWSFTMRLWWECNRRHSRSA